MERNMSILPVKLKMPQPRKNYIIRQKLFEQLEKYEEYKVAVVKAGAGCGKTTLLSSFILEQAVENVCWITLDENANQIFVFWNYVIEALQAFLEDAKSDFQNLFDSNIQKENLWRILDLLLSRLDKDRCIMLVLDDFQMITDDYLIATLDKFIEQMPDNLHIVLLTREMPAIYLGALAMADQLLIIEEDTVRLTKEESREFLLETLKLQKNEEQIHSMIEVSEGWIGGLQLLAMSAKEGNGQIMESLKVSTRVLNDYITKEIFEFLSEKEKEFLIETSILSYFNQTICEKFHPDIDFPALMESILQKNLLVINVDENAGIYRYHAILAEYLKGLFEKQDPGKKENLHSQAASIFAEIGDYEESLHHLFCIHAYERIMKLILKMPQTAMTFSFLMKVPMEEIVKNADFAYQYFFYYYASTDEVVSKKIYQFIKRNMKDEQTFEAFQFSNLFFSDALDFQRANPLTLEQIQSLPLNDITTAFLLIKEAYFLYANSNFKEAINYLNYAGDVYKKTGNIYIGVFVLSEKAQIYEDMGELGICFDLYRELKPMVEQIKSLASSYYIGIAGVYIRQMSLDLAYEMLEKAKAGLSEDSVSIGRAYQYTLAEYCYLTGETELTEKMLIDIMGQEAYDNVAYSARLLRYPLYRGKHMELAKRFLESYHENDSLVDNMDGQLLYASIQYETDNYETAVALVDSMIANARKMQNKLKIIECDLLKARMLLEQNGERRDIKNLFMEAVSYAMENGIAHPFWFEKNTVNRIVYEMKPELLKELSKEEFDFINSMLSADPKHGIVPKSKTKEENGEVLLTEREKEVLQELAAGSTNMQIAERLCVSLATVKTHINNIYGKLGVNNRVAAVNAVKASRLDCRVDNSIE